MVDQDIYTDKVKIIIYTHMLCMLVRRSLGEASVNKSTVKKKKKEEKHNKSRKTKLNFNFVTLHLPLTLDVLIAHSDSAGIIWLHLVHSCVSYLVARKDEQWMTG